MSRCRQQRPERLRRQRHRRLLRPRYCGFVVVAVADHPDTDSHGDDSHGDDSRCDLPGIVNTNRDRDIHEGTVVPNFHRGTDDHRYTVPDADRVLTHGIRDIDRATGIDINPDDATDINPDLSPNPDLGPNPDFGSNPDLGPNPDGVPDRSADLGWDAHGSADTHLRPDPNGDLNTSIQCHVIVRVDNHDSSHAIRGVLDNPRDTDHTVGSDVYRDIGPLFRTNIDRRGYPDDNLDCDRDPGSRAVFFARHGQYADRGAHVRADPFFCHNVINPGPDCVIHPGPDCVINPGPDCDINSGPDCDIHPGHRSDINDRVNRCTVFSANVVSRVLGRYRDTDDDLFGTRERGNTANYEFNADRYTDICGSPCDAGNLIIVIG